MVISVQMLSFVSSHLRLSCLQASFHPVTSVFSVATSSSSSCSRLVLTVAPGELRPDVLDVAIDVADLSSRFLRTKAKLQALVSMAAGTK